jgi:hypothetical protein
MDGTSGHKLGADVTLRQKFAIVLFTLTGPILTLDYWQHGGVLTFFGWVPIRKLFIVATVGGACSFTLYANRSQRWFAPVTGALAGFGAFGSHIVYTEWFKPQTIWNYESLLVAGVGALPGILMFWGAARLRKQNNGNPQDDPKPVAEPPTALSGK